jgi:hypothetical protein
MILTSGIHINKPIAPICPAFENIFHQTRHMKNTKPTTRIRPIRVDTASDTALLISLSFLRIAF